MKNKGSLLYLQIKDKIFEIIITKKVNDRIPSRNELIKEFNVTRTTIDRAISELIGEGYLYSRDGSGTYVSKNSRQVIQSRDNNHITWGVILPNIMHDTYPGILRGVEDAANENDINVVICNTDNKIEKQTNYINKQIAAGINGLIIVPAITNEIDIAPFKMLQKESIPFVFCNRGVPGIDAPKVISNNFYGGYMLTNHIIQNGYSKIGFVSRPMYSISLERYQGYIAALAEASFEFDEDYVVFEKSFDEVRPGYESTKKLLSNKELPDAIFCFNDVIAVGAYDAVTEIGLRVGIDICIVGYDNTRICETLAVKLTSVKFKKYETGNIAANLLLKILKGENVPDNKTVVLQPELVIRESSKKILKTNVIQLP